MKVAKGAMYVARAADLASNAYAFCVGAHDTAEQIKTIQQKLYNGESVSADEYGRMALSAICTVISGVSTAASLKGFGTVDDDLALLASKYKKVAPEIDNPTTTKMTGGVDKTPDVEIKSKSSEPSMEYNLQLFAKKVDDAYQTSYGKSSVKQKTGPKPQGTGPHNLKIEEIASQITDGEVIAGGGIYKEKVIPTPNGVKSGRRPDILVRKPDGTMYGINVGKTTAQGAPIKREVEALYDLEDAGLPMYFVGYDK